MGHGLEHHHTYLRTVAQGVLLGFAADLLLLAMLTLVFLTVQKVRSIQTARWKSPGQKVRSRIQLKA